MDCYRYGQGCRSTLTESVSLRRRALRDDVNFTNFSFWIKYHFNIFTVLLFYCAILVFLVQKFYCPVATHGDATMNKFKPTLHAWRFIERFVLYVWSKTHHSRMPSLSTLSPFCSPMRIFHCSVYVLSLYGKGDDDSIDAESKL